MHDLNHLYANNVLFVILLTSVEFCMSVNHGLDDHILHPVTIALRWS